MRQHHRNGLVPPGQAAQIGLALRVVLAGQVHACQHGADLGAVAGAGREFAAALEAVDDRGRLVLELVQDLALGIGGRIRHRNALAGQMLHQVQVERQLLEGQALEQRQHIVMRLAVAQGADEIVGVLDAAGAAFDVGELAQVEPAQQGGGFGLADLGENGHGRGKRA